MIFATFLGSLIPVSGHCISSQLIGTIGVFEPRLHDAANPLAVAVNYSFIIIIKYIKAQKVSHLPKTTPNSFSAVLKLNICNSICGITFANIMSFGR